MFETRFGIEDPSLLARVLTRTPLRYTLGADVALDRPAHVRAGSGLARLGARRAVVQDDASFIALVDADGVRALTLDHAPGGKRQFDDTRGNKKDKLDLEACVVLGDLLVAFGSGSLPERERIVVVQGERARIVDAHALYAALHLEAFAGSELNVEGACLVGGSVRLFQRGNGAFLRGIAPVDATCDLDARALLAYLDDPSRAPPEPTHITRHALGAIDGVRLTFTDAFAREDHVYFLAAAEDAPDAVRDGPVVGCAVGLFDARGTARWARLRDAEGAPFLGKAEGLVVDADGRRAQLVLDLDDPEIPSELCEVELAGDWG